MLESYHKLQPKAQTIPEFEDALQLNWTDLLYLPQKSIDNAAAKDFRKRLQTCVSASERRGGHFEHKTWWSHNIYWQLCYV